MASFRPFGSSWIFAVAFAAGAWLLAASSALAGTSTLVNHSGQSLICPFTNVCTITPETCTTGMTCTITGDGFGVLRVETPPEDQDTVPEIVFAGSVAGCDDVIDHHCNPQLAIGGGTIHAAVLRYASLSRTGGPLAEAAGEATYSATLDAPTTLDVVVSLAFSGAAAKDTDYTASATTITIPAGATTGSAAVEVTATQDIIDELDESVVVDIGAVRYGRENGAQQESTTITDDDPTPTVTLALDGSPLAENGGEATLTATLSHPSSRTVTVPLSFSGTATRDTDYFVSATSIAIPAGQLTATVTLDTLDDSRDEADESVIVDIGSPVNAVEDGTQQVTATIVDDDPTPTVQLVLSGSPLAEAAGSATVSAVLSAVSGREVTVSLNWAGNATHAVDYTRSATDIVIPAGSTGGSVQIDAIDDGDDEPDETVIADVTSVTNGTELGGFQQVIAMIADDDALAVPQVSLDALPADVRESDGSVIVTARLSATTSLPVRLDLAIGGEVVPDVDYTAPLQLVVSPGALAGTVEVPLLDDLVDEPAKSLTVTVTAIENATPVGAQGAVTVLRDDDLPVLSLSMPPTAAEGDVAVVSASLAMPSTKRVVATLAFGGTAGDPSDYFTAEQTIELAPGNLVYAVPITVVDDALREADETIELSVQSYTAPDEGLTGASSASASLTILDDDPPPLAELSLSGSPFAENGGAAVVTVTLERVSDFDATIDFAFSGAAQEGVDYLASASSVLVPKGTTEGTITLTGLDDALFETDEDLIVTVVGANEALIPLAPEVTAVIADDDVPPVATIADAASVDEGATLGFTVSLDTVAVSDVAIALDHGGGVDDADFASRPTQLVVPAGFLSASLALDTIDDGVYEGDEIATVTLLPGPGYTVGAPATGTGTVRETSLVPQAITAFAATPTAPVFVAGGTFTVSATGGASGNPVVFGTTSPGVCTVLGDVVSMLAAGTCSLTADQAGDAEHAAAPQATLDVEVGLASQAITAFAATPATPVFSPGGTFTVSAIGGASGNPVVFGSGSPAVCTVVGDTVTMLAAGTCALTADQAGDANHTAAPQTTLDVEIGLAAQTITAFVANPAAPVFSPGGTFTVSASGGASGNPVVFGSTSPGVCTVLGDTVTMLAAGTCALTADQAGDTNYEAALQATLDVGIGLATQTITAFTANPAAPVFSPGGTFTVSATGGASGNPVVFGSTSPAVCTVAGDTVTMLAAGTCALTADQAGDTNYAAAPQATLDVGIGLATQTITAFLANPAAPVFSPGGTFTVSATGGASGNPVMFGSTSPAVCTVAGDTVTMLAVGTCTITADQAGDANYAPAPQATLAIGIGMAAQNITAFVANPAAPVFAPGGTFTVSATGGASGNPVVFGSGSPAICTVAGDTVTMLAAGTCALTADQAGDANYAPAPQATLDVDIGLAAQTITAFSANPAAPVFVEGGTFTVSATGGASGNPVVFGSTSPAVCTVAGDTVTILAAGTCALTADQAGDANYAAAPQATLAVDIGMAAQSITAFAATPAAPVFSPGGTFIVSAMGGASGNPIVFGSTSPVVCTVAGDTVTMLAAGTCALTADQAGDANYAAAPQATLAVDIGMAAQTITAFVATPAAPVFAPGGTFSVGATGGASGNPVIFGSTSPAVCTVAGDAVTMLAAGTCMLTADQAGDANYAPAPQATLDVDIGLATQAITAFAANPAAPVFSPGGTFTLSAIGGPSGHPIVFGSGSPAVCTVAGDTVTMLAAGTCELTADQAGDANYAPAPQATLAVDIGIAAQTITAFVATPATPVFAPGGTFSVAATGGASGNPVIFGSTSPAVCTVAGDTVTMLAAGTCMLTADQAGDANYAPAPQATLDVDIGLASQTITAFVATPATPVFGPGGTFTVSATGGASGNPLVFASTSPAVCTVAGDTVTMLAAGTCALTADQAGDANYAAAAQATLDVDVGLAAQTITAFVATPATPVFAPGGTFTVSATGGASGNPVVFASTSPAVCTVAGDTVTMLAAGTCALTADQAGDANYAPAPQATLQVDIGLATQTITAFSANPAAPVFVEGGTFTVSATGGASGNPVVFGSTSPAVCTVAGDTVTMFAAGTCALTADQAGDANYSPAPQATLQVDIGLAAQTITAFSANPAAPVFVEGGTFTVSATGGASGNPVVFGSTSPAVCTVAGDTVTMLAAGTCALTADQAGGADYAAAPQATLEVDIGLAPQAITAFAATPAAPVFTPGGTFTVSATGGASGNPVVFASMSPAVCTVAGNTVTMLAAGTCVLTADQAGDANHTAAPQATLDIVLAAITPTLAWIDDLVVTFGAPDFDLPDPASDSPGAFTFASSDPAVATIDGRHVTIVGPGVTLLTATQAPASSWLGATIQVQLTVGDRPDPTGDPGVVSGLQAQADTSVRFASGQIANIQGRLGQLRAGGANHSANGLALQLRGGRDDSLSLPSVAGGDDALPRLPDGWALWTAGTIVAGDRDGRGAAPGFAFDSDAVTIGLDRAIGDHALLGVAAGLGWADVDHDGSTSALDAGYRSFALYGLLRGEGRWFADAVLGWGRLDFDIVRESATAGANAHARRDGEQRFAALTLGYQHQAALSGLTSYLRWEGSRTTLDAYRETGLGVYDLAYAQQDVDDSTLAAGVERRYTFAGASARYSPYWSLEYRESLGDRSDVDINYVVRPAADAYTLSLDGFGRSATTFGAGLDVAFRTGWTLSLLFDREQGSDGGSTGFGLRLAYGLPGTVRDTDGVARHEDSPPASTPPR